MNVAGKRGCRHRRLKGKVNILHYVTRQYMYRNKKRTFTTWIGIVFMVLLMTCVFVGKDTAISYLQRVASAKDGKWHYAMYDVTEEQEQKAVDLGYIKEMSESLELGMTEFSQSGSEERPYLNVKAYGMQCFDWYNIRLTEGRLPENAQELVISAACLSDGSGIQIGDVIDASYFERSVTGIQKDKRETTLFPYYHLEIKKGETVEVPQNFPYYGENDSFRENKEMTGMQESYTVVGFMEVPAFEEEHAAGYTALTRLDKEMLKEAVRRNVSLIVDLGKAPDTCNMELEEIAGEGNLDANNVYLAFTGDSSDSTMNIMVNLMTVFFVVLIMFASVILIYNVFNLSFRERSRYLGMLSSVGATSRQKRSSVYYEAFHSLFIALPLGILAGFGVIWLGMMMLQPYILKFIYSVMQMQEVPVVLDISVEALLAVVVASAFTVLVSAFLPAWKIGKTGAVESIRGNESKKHRIYKMRKRISGKFGAEKMLAGNFLKRQRRKKRSISLADIIFLVILLVTAFGTDSIHTVLENKTSHTVNISTHLQDNECMLCYIPEEADEDSGENGIMAKTQYDAVKKEISKHPAVEHVEEWYESMFCCFLDTSFFSEEYWNAYRSIAEAYVGDRMSREEIDATYITDHRNPANILVVDDETLREMAKCCGADYALLTDKERMGVIVINEAELSTDELWFEQRNAARYLYYDIEHVSDMQEGAAFTAGFYPKDGEIEDIPFTLSAYADNEKLSDYVTVRGEWPWLLMGRTVAGELAKRCGYSDISEMFEEEFRIRLNGDNEELLEYLEHIADDTENIQFLRGNEADIQKSMMETIADIVDIMLLCFVFLTSGICLMNLGNAIGGRMTDRRKEFAILQSVGMTRTQILKMLLFECSGMLLEAVVVAVLVSAGFIWMIREVLSSLFGHLVLRIPYFLIALAVVFTIGAVLLLTLYSFGKVKEENLLEEIRNESV